MKTTMTTLVASALWIVAVISPYSTLVAAESCTLEQIAKASALKQDSAVVMACAPGAAGMDPPTDPGMLDICANKECVAAIQDAMEALPNCEVSGVALSAQVEAMLSGCADGKVVTLPGGGPPPKGGNASLPSGGVEEDADDLIPTTDETENTDGSLPEDDTTSDGVADLISATDGSTAEPGSDSSTDSGSQLALSPVVVVLTTGLTAIWARSM